MDLTPRTNDESSAPSKKKRRWMPIFIVVAAMSAGGVVVTKFLTSAIDYYCNVDEVGVKVNVACECKELWKKAQ